MNVAIGAKTDPGRRTNNEDYFSVVDVRRHRLQADGLLVIADGMGGRHRGEQAAATAVETIQETLVEMLAGERAARVDTGEALVSALRKANARVYEMSRHDQEGQGMGTTCVAAVVQDQRLTLAHAGDSRAYLLRGGVLSQLTGDHSYVAEQVRAGAITEEGARQSRFRNVITRAVGIEPTIAPDVSRHDVQAGDVLLLCTDGLSNIVSAADISQTLEYAPTPQAAADRLVQQANRAGGKDNITAIVARLEVGNHTMQMQTDDLPRFPGTATLPEGEADGEEAFPAQAPRNGVAYSPSAQSLHRVWPATAAVLAVLFGCLSAGLAHVLEQGGYRFHLAPPFLSQPAPAPTAPLSSAANLASLVYNQPAAFFVKPVQGGLLSRDPRDGSLTVVTLDGRVVRLSSSGAVLSESPPLPKKAAADPVAFPAAGDMHVALDPQGDFYVADPAARAVVKYGPELGKPVGKIPGIGDPGAIAVAPDGTIYIIDNERLKVIRPVVGL